MNVLSEWNCSYVVLCIQNKIQSRKLLGKEMLKCMWWMTQAFRVDFSSTGWGRNMRTVLLSISVAVSTPLIQWDEHKRSSVLIRGVGRQVEFYHLVILLFGLPKRHIMLFLPSAFQKGTAGILVPAPSRLQDEGWFRSLPSVVWRSSGLCHDPLLHQVVDLQVVVRMKSSGFKNELRKNKEDSESRDSSFLGSLLFCFNLNLLKNLSCLGTRGSSIFKNMGILQAGSGAGKKVGNVCSPLSYLCWPPWGSPLAQCRCRGRLGDMP